MARPESRRRARANRHTDAHRRRETHDMDPELIKKKREYEERKARTKLALKQCTICGAENAKLCQGCGTTAYCSTACQRVDWRDRGHREACKKIRNERAAEAARAEAPTPPPSPPKEIFYGPAPRSHADEVRARIAAEHEAARARREANPEPEPVSARMGSRCPICHEDWDVNAPDSFLPCCCRKICQSCRDKIGSDVCPDACPLCRLPHAKSEAEGLARLRRHVENEVPEALTYLGDAYRGGWYGLVKSDKKAVKIYKRAVELGDVDAMASLATVYMKGDGVRMDRKKGTKLNRMAADRGSVTAQLNLALTLDEDGWTGPPGTWKAANKCSTEAFQMYERAAEQGSMKAMFNYAVCYIHGAGVERDISKGLLLIRRLAAKGDENSIAALKKINSLK